MIGSIRNLFRREARYNKVVHVMQPDGSWRLELRGLRAVRKGERFRLSEPAEWLTVLEAVATENGHVALDDSGHLCGEVEYTQVRSTDTAKDVAK